MTEEYKFQKLRVYQLALDYVDAIYALSVQLPDTERYNLKTQIERAATSIVLNIAEGSTGQTDAEQSRFLGHSIRSYLETIACIDLIIRRDYVDEISLKQTKKLGHELFVKLQAFRKSLRK
jgi:four helix bundle protein